MLINLIGFLPRLDAIAPTFSDIPATPADVISPAASGPLVLIAVIVIVVVAASAAILIYITKKKERK
jgi:hypothetical protein